MTDCIFCKIVKGEIPSKKVAEDKDVIAFYDIDPSADTHILIVPKKHTPTFLDIGGADKDTISQMISVAQKLIKKKKLGRKYRISFNGGSLQIVRHLHMHLLAGELKGGALK